jgi:hypothetical protein
MIVDRDSGEITVTDKAGAERITFSSDNFAKDSAKLRHVLAESLLFTVAYRASRTVRSGPKFSARYGFFELKQSTKIENLQDYLNIAECLGLLSLADAKTRLGPLANGSDAGRSTFYADVSFNDAACENLFLDAQGGARAEAEYQGIGRHALSELLRPGEPTTRARMVPLKDDAIWARMIELGPPNDFSGLFNGMGFNVVELGGISSDYILITWWSGAMRNTSVSLAGLLAYLKQNPGWSPLDAKFLALRGDLEKKLAAVAAKTQSQFSEPWGLVAMYMASGQQAARSLRLVCTKLTLLL